MRDIRETFIDDEKGDIFKLWNKKIDNISHSILEEYNQELKEADEIRITWKKACEESGLEIENITVLKRRK